MGISIGDGVTLGVFIAGISGYLINSWLDRKTKAAMMRTDAYLDYLRAENTLSVIEWDRKHPEFQRMDALALNARSRILLYGSKAVVATMKRLYGLTPDYHHAETLAAFTDLLSEMRNDCIGERLSKEEVARILLFKQADQLPPHARD